MIQLKVELGSRSYPVFIGKGLLSSDRVLGKILTKEKNLVITNKKVGTLYFEKLETASKALGVEVTPLFIEDGEKYKNLDTLSFIYDELIRQGYDRQSSIIALGGGVVGDIAGFAAATYQRGVPFIQIPTTLLAQVDSSVGGKTAVNHSLGKNMIGAFYQPEAVIIDIETLSSLPKRQVSSGLAEVIKYGLIQDAEFFSWLEANMHNLTNGQTEALSYAIEKSCSLKAEIVSQDERENSSRALLNFGHTFGHAIEVSGQYSRYLHGEAVAMGSMLALSMSRRMGLLDASVVEKIRTVLKNAGLPTTPPNLGKSLYLKLMQRDKKVKNGRIRLVLLRDIGEAYISDDYDSKSLELVLSMEG